METLSAIFPIDFLQMVMKSLAFATALGQHVNLNSPCENSVGILTAAWLFFLQTSIVTYQRLLFTNRYLFLWLQQKKNF